MKRRLSILFIILVLVTSVFIFIGPTVKYAVKAQLRKIFIGSSISVGSCNISPLHRLSLSNIEISRKPAYDLKIKDINIEYSLASLIRRSIAKVSLGDAIVYVNLPKNNPTELSSYYRLSPQSPKFLINYLELSNFSLDITLRDLSLSAKVSLGLDIANRLIDYCRVNIDSLEVSGLALENISLEKTPTSPMAVLHIDKFSYNKLKVNTILGYAALKNNSLSIDPLSAALLNGNLKGRISVTLDKGLNYIMDLEFKGLDLETFADEFNLKEKTTLSGRLDGAVSLKGSGTHIEILGGDFSTLAPGGTLTIKDSRYLENIAQRSGQSMDIIVESFKNYGYNNGVMKLSLDKGSIVLNIGLDGNAGKRNLDIILHDVLK